MIFSLCFRALVGHVRERVGITFMSTSIWLEADWDWWIVKSEAHSWNSVTIVLFAHLAVLASRRNLSFAVVEQAFSSIETGLFASDRLALCNDILVVIELWNMGTDVHFG